MARISGCVWVQDKMINYSWRTMLNALSFIEKFLGVILIEILPKLLPKVPVYINRHWITWWLRVIKAKRLYLNHRCHFSTNSFFNSVAVSVEFTCIFTYEGIESRSTDLRHGQVITSRIILWDVITYTCSGYMLRVQKCSFGQWIFRKRWVECGWNTWYSFILFLG